MIKKALSLIVALGVFVVSILFSEQPLPPGDGAGGGSSSLGHLENYDSVTKTKWCTEITYEYDFIQDRFVYKVVVRQVDVYYLKEQCDPGGTSCKVGTVRLTYQSGGCN